MLNYILSLIFCFIASLLMNIEYKNYNDISYNKIMFFTKNLIIMSIYSLSNYFLKSNDYSLLLIPIILLAGIIDMIFSLIIIMITQTKTKNKVILSFILTFFVNIFYSYYIISEV